MLANTDFILHRRTLSPICCVSSTISDSSRPCGPAFFSTWKQMPLIVPLH